MIGQWRKGIEMVAQRFLNPLMDRKERGVEMAGDFPEVQQAVERARTDRAALLRPDGTRRYTDAEHVEREQAINGRLDSDLDAIIESARSDEAAARAELEGLEVERDPLAGLSTADLERAAALREFVREDVETLPWTDVLSRIEISKGDKVLALLMIRYARRRLDAERGTASGLAESIQIRGAEEALLEYELSFADPAIAKRKNALRERIENNQRRAGAAGRQKPGYQRRVSRSVSL
jgi:hypothetical protein